MLGALLVGRALVVAVVVNPGRVPAAMVHGVQFHGRYYPVEKVCLVVDADKLSESLHSDPARRDETLQATGNRFEDLYGTPGVVIGCGWQNRDAGDHPAVQFRFDAAIAANRRAGGPACEPERPTMRTSTIHIGRYTSCQWTDTASAGDYITDDNLSIACNVKVPEAALLPAAWQATRGECLHLIDRLANAKPPSSFWGDSFWTGR